MEAAYDERLTGRGSAAAGFDTAVGWDPIEHLQWEFDKALPENIIGAPQEIVDYYTGTEEAS